MYFKTVLFFECLLDVNRFWVKCFVFWIGVSLDVIIIFIL